MYLINSMLQGLYWKPREARKIFFPTFDEQLGCWSLVFIFPCFTQIHNILVAPWHGTSGQGTAASPLNTFCSCAQVLAAHQLQGQENLLHIRFATILCIGWIPWAFLLAKCPTIESAKISGNDLSLLCFHHVQCYSCKLVLLSCTIDLILNFFFLFFWLLGNGANDVWICAEKRPLGELPGLSICSISAHRGIDSVTQVMLSWHPWGSWAWNQSFKISLQS